MDQAQEVLRQSRESAVSVGPGSRSLTLTCPG